jgi:serine/threonine protein kinase/Tol biopolymer transport system component/tetratricopeptide (TPR) repeat protein
MAGTPQEVKAIFAEAIGKATPQEQAAYLDTACGSDGRLRAEIESLVSAHRDAGPFLRVLLEDQEAVGGGPLTEGPGTVIGRYKLLEKIGEGGMAVVYMAEQEQPIRRKVALKIIKLGMDTRQVIARFEAERQALALMDHPSIAKVLDAGATETGRPYFVMELVTGVSITEYCDKNSLCTKDRLALFLQVCHAVQHAHQKGIIHRDLKPSNVMVTHHDGKPVPKVIDFGIAKATNQRLTEKTLFTRYAHIIGTPAYMSPEQAELSDLDIDTRSDIYSLGVLLYELLTGTTPFSEEELRKAGYVEMQRVIREQEPVKPSTRIRTALRSMGVPPMKSRGHLGPAFTGETPVVLMGGTPMLREVRGDLDWIVMKSLEKDRARRYETASGLAEDVRRHLEHEPVLARGPGTGYRLHKFLRRHRSQTIAVLAMAVVVGAGIVILSMWNRDRLQLVEAEGFRHRGILSQAREQYAKADRDAALETIKPILDSKHVGLEAQLLHAGILVDNRRSKEAVTILNGLLNDRPEIAGAAHALLARILWESESPDAEKLKEIEEHRRKAEAMLPETAEAYFLRAMTALTVKEQLASLDKALQLDSGHYEARRLRAFTYYASRKYDRLRDDALAMTILRPRDPLGYSLRAKAWRESGRYKDAIADYDSALALTAKDSPAYVDLSTQRCETLLRMGDYERVIAEAPVGAKNLSPLQYHVFCALTALGDYDKATALYRQIISPGQEQRSQFENWCGKYVLDSLQAGRSWHPADREPAGPAFLPMVEAEEVYGELSAKARRVTTDGFGAQWSPDGKRLAFSLGVYGYSGIAVFDPAIKETDLLIVPGQDPKWSPDGKHIAFVRDHQILRLEELATAERKDRERLPRDEEVWVMNADGTEPRLVARGGWSGWGPDSTCVYYLSRLDNTLYSISLAGPDAEPKRIAACPSPWLALSRDGQRLAYLEGGWLAVKDLTSQTVAAQWRTPPSVGEPVWSPAGDELCTGGNGIWFYRLGQTEPVRVLAGDIAVGTWTTDGTKLVFSLGRPYLEIWNVDLDPQAPAGAALGPAQSLNEHLRQRIAFYTRRIEADPQDAYAHAARARYHDYLQERTQVQADMGRWRALVGGGASASPARTAGLEPAPADADLIYGEPSNLGPAINTASNEIAPYLSPDGLELYFFRGTDPAVEVWVARRATPDGAWGPAVKHGAPFRDSGGDGIGCITPDGLTLFMDSDRPGGCGAADLWVATRATRSSLWGTPTNLGAVVNSAFEEFAASLSTDGRELYFTSNRPGGAGSNDLWVTQRTTVHDPWGAPVNLGQPLNSSTDDNSASTSPNGLLLFFTSRRSGGYGTAYGLCDVYVARRATTQDPWGPPKNCGPVVNSPYVEWMTRISADGSMLFFHSNRPGGFGSFDIWQTPIIRVGDFNGGKVKGKED